ncbi:MAG: metal ABC transporter permease, partial [Nitrospirae bacterium]
MLEIFQFDFMVRAFVGGIIIAVICPLIGTFLVVRRYSLMADTLAHVSLSGVALGMLIGVDPVLTALIVSITSAFGVERLRIKGKIYGESALGLFLWGGLSLSVILISFAHGFNMKLFSFLFGSITTVSESDLHLMYIIGFISIAFVFLFYKELFAISFDEEVAKVSGINANLFNSSLVVIAAMVVSLSMRIVGILLVGALMVIP